MDDIEERACEFYRRWTNSRGLYDLINMLIKFGNRERAAALRDAMLMTTEEL